MVNVNQTHVVQTKPPCVTVTATTEPECTSTTGTPQIVIGTVFAKIPIVLADLTVQINLDATIILPLPAIEIKRIKKRLKITQCLLLQTSSANKLFLKGFVRKNIEFATRSTCSVPQGFCGEIHDCTVDIPFSCVTPITTFLTLPNKIVPNVTNEFEFLRTSALGPEFAEKDELESGDFTEFNQTTNERLNERPYCELVNAVITEFDEFLNRKHPADTPFEEIEFNKIEEKMVIELTIQLLQKNIVKLNG